MTLIILLLLACSTELVVRPYEPEPLAHDTAERLPESEPPAEDIDDGGVTVYEPDTVHTLELTLEEDDYWELYRNSESYSVGEPVYVPVSVTFDGETVDDAGLRIKGRWGTWRNMNAKASFRVDFNRYVPGQTFHGLKALTVNNMIIDCSFMRERFANRVYAAMDLPAPRTSYVWVTVNDEPYGLYANVETVDDVFLARHYDDPTGNLYDADYYIWSDNSYTVLDFYADLVDLYELEEGEDVGAVDLLGVAEALDAHAGTADFYENTADVIDWDYHHRLIAAEMWVGQVDGYSLNRNNYLAYFNADDGRVQLLPWDQDYTYVRESDWGFSWYTPQGLLSYYCIADANCRADLMVQLAVVIEVAEGLELADEMAATAELIDPYIAEDPRRECNDDYVAYYRSLMAAWHDGRSAEIKAAWEF